jgi:hypothetical protein
MSGATLQPNAKETRRLMFLDCLRNVSEALFFDSSWPQNLRKRNILLTNWNFRRWSRSELRARSQNGLGKSVVVTGVTK